VNPPRRVAVTTLLTAALLGLTVPAGADTAPPQPTTDLQALIDYYDCVPYMHGNNVAGWLRLVTYWPDEPTWEHVAAVGERTWADTDDCKR
jgi:hypothetical protein